VSLRGNSGFQVTAPSGATVTHVLATPFRASLVPAHRKVRFVSDTLDLSDREVISIGDGRAEIEGTIRLERRSQSLIDVLSLAADGRTITYFPDFGVGTGYPFRLINPEDVIDLLGDRARYRLSEYEIRVRFRDASASGQSLEALFSPWLWRFSAADRLASFSRTGAASYTAVDGLLKSAATGVPRETWSLVGGVLTPALRMERAVDNELLHSEALDNAAWTKVGLAGTPIVVNQATGPDGVAALDEMVENTSFAEHGVSRAVTGMTADGTYVLSAWAIANTRTWIRLRISETADVANRCGSWFDLANGVAGLSDAAGTGSLVRAYMEDWTHVAAGLYRCVVVGTVGDGATALTAMVSLTTDDGVSAHTGDGSSLYAGYVQLEDSMLVASSYVPTTTAAVTRGAEYWRTPYTPVPQAGTWYWKFRERSEPNWVAAGGASPRIQQLGADDDTGFRLAAYKPIGAAVYRVAFGTSGGDEDTASVALSPARGDIIELRLSTDEDGVGTFEGVKNITGTPVTDSIAVPGGLLSAYSDELLALGSRNASAGQGDVEILEAFQLPGEKSMDECREMAG
jgi:hypothetical protein